jgi:tetratricopeptide (TPR) repeat protein
MTPEESMFQEALAAINQGERSRARDLFTRLLKINPNNYQYWLWMSSAVDTVRERTYCLKEVIRLDPQNQTARRGLIMVGALPRDESLVIPYRLQKRRWDVPKIIGNEQSKGMTRSSWIKFAGFGVVVILLGALLLVGIFGPKQLRFPFLSNTYKPATGPYTVVQYTPLISGSLASATATGPSPLWMLLKETYTPTPIYVNTPHPRTEAYRTGLRALERQDWVAAYTYFQQVATLEPQSPDLYYYMGETLRNQKKYDQAIGSYNQALQVDPGFAPAYLGLARAKIAKNPANSSEAQDELKQAIDKDPNLFEAYLELASIAIDQNDSSSASQYLDQAAQIEPSSPLVYYYRAQADLIAGNTDQAVADAQQANKLDLTDLDSYRLLGEVSQSAGQASSAIDALKTYLAYSPDDAQALAWLGAAYAANDQNDLALKTFNLALSLNSNQIDVYFQRGLVYLEQKNGDLAVKDLQKAVNLGPKSFTANMALGKAFMLVNKYGNAYQQFSVAEAYTTSDRDHAEMYYWRAQSLENLDEIKAAVLNWQQLLALPPENIPADWISFAQQRLQALSTPTNTPITVTPSSTRQPTRTVTITLTRQPTRTQTPTRTSTGTVSQDTPTLSLTPIPIP